jgi:hypothetical protein
MEKAAQRAFPPAACPQCNHIQARMLRYYRGTKFARAHALILTALIFIVAITTIMMVVVGSFQMLRSPTYWAFVLTPAALLAGIHLLRRYSHPKLPPPVPAASAPAE